MDRKTANNSENITPTQEDENIIETPVEEKSGTGKTFCCFVMEIVLIKRHCKDCTAIVKKATIKNKNVKNYHQHFFQIALDLSVGR